MKSSEVYRFVYTRSQGLKRSYDVTINVARLDSGYSNTVPGCITKARLKEMASFSRSHRAMPTTRQQRRVVASGTISSSWQV